MKIKEVLEILNIDVFSNNMFFQELISCSNNVLNRYGIEQTEINNSIYGNIFKSDNATNLMIDYFFERSNEKNASPFLLKMLKRYEDGRYPAIIVFYSQLGYRIMDKFAFKWWKLSEAITTKYKPLENYDMEEQKNVATDVNVHQESESGIYGFNSTESNPTATGSGDNHTTGLKAGNEEVLTRHGNIGVTTSQQMLESEIVLREKHNLIEMIFKDIDSVLCLKVY